jgi:F420-dependent oxidoreductase-like protein
MTIKLGLLIPKFSYEATGSGCFSSVIAQAQEAESAGFDAVMVLDHFYQPPDVGPPEDPMLEAYTTLGGLATVTKRLQLGTLVTCNTFRNPALLAKIVSTLDVVSGGRALLGMGAGWFELEHKRLGFEFGTFTDRFNRLEEALQIIVPMLKGEQPTFQGDWYRVESALNNARARDDMPILLGGSGERKMFSLAARYADHLNVMAPLAELRRKIEVLARRCEEYDRDPVTLETSTALSLVVDDDRTGAHVLEQGPVTLFGSLEQIADQIKRKVIDAGVNGVIVDVVADGYTPGLITRVGEALRPVVGF